MNTRVYPKANTLVSVRETKLLNKEQWQSLLQSKSFEAAVSQLMDWGYLPAGASRHGNANKLVNQKLAELLSFLWEIAPDPKVTELFTLRYDLNNLKSLLREKLEGAASALWMDAVGLTREQLLLQVKTQGAPLAELFDAMQKSWEAHSAWQRVTLMGEQFYYARLQSLAKAFEEPEISQFVAVLTDYYNLSLLLARREGTALPPEGGYLPGGTLPQQALQDDAFQATGPYQAVLARPALFDTLKDNDLMRRAVKAKMTAFGLVPICGYFFAAMMELKDLRLILTAKENNLPLEKVAERMRMRYEI